MTAKASEESGGGGLGQENGGDGERGEWRRRARTGEWWRRRARRVAAKASEKSGGGGLGQEKSGEGISRICMSPDDHFVTGFERTPVTDYMTISNGRCRKARY
jgi:hypothetical protein